MVKIKYKFDNRNRDRGFVRVLGEFANSILNEKNSRYLSLGIRYRYERGKTKKSLRGNNEDLIYLDCESGVVFGVASLKNTKYHITTEGRENNIVDSLNELMLRTEICLYKIKEMEVKI
jgi:hypothetical protein